MSDANDVIVQKMKQWFDEHEAKTDRRDPYDDRPDDPYRVQRALERAVSYVTGNCQDNSCVIVSLGVSPLTFFDSETKLQEGHAVNLLCHACGQRHEVFTQGDGSVVTVRGAVSNVNYGVGGGGCHERALVERSGLGPLAYNIGGSSAPKR